MKRLVLLCGVVLVFGFLSDQCNAQCRRERPVLGAVRAVASVPVRVLADTAPVIRKVVVVPVRAVKGLVQKQAVRAMVGVSVRAVKRVASGVRGVVVGAVERAPLRTAVHQVLCR
jgi:hypothetical protein